MKRLISWIKARIAEALRRRFSLSLTVEGMIIVAMMVLIGLAALNTAVPLLYMMFAMMCAFFILSAILATNTIRSLDVARACPTVWVAGKPMVVEVRLTNGKLLSASYSLRVRDLLKDGTIAGAVFYERVEARRAQVTQRYECLFTRRGLYRFQDLQIATRFPFGLIERVISFRTPQEVLILPQTINVQRRMQAARSELGDFESNRKGSGTGLYGLREYSPEIPARDIHWKVSARRGVLIAREFESEEKRRAVVLLDNQVPKGQQLAAFEAFERGVVLAASVVEWLIEKGHEVELRTASGIVGYGSGPTHLTRCRRALASLHLVEPMAASQRLLGTSAPDVTHFQVDFAPGATPSAGRSFRVAIEDFDAELRSALHPPREKPEDAVVVPLPVASGPVASA
jgi:uncharacterized protein (DUF58 family)